MEARARLHRARAVRHAAACKGGGFQNRRDYAIISLFNDADIRLSELAGLALDDVNPACREATVTGKGGKQRTGIPDPRE